MTRAAARAGSGLPRLPILSEHENEGTVALLLVTGDRGLAGSFNSQIVRAGVRAGAERQREGKRVVYYAVGRRGASSLTFRGQSPERSFIGFTDRPAYANAREIAETLRAAYTDERIDRLEVLYNGYVSAMSQQVRHETLLPLQRASVLEASEGEDGEEADTGHSGVEYEPDPEEILERLVPDYVEISIYRALLESTAAEHGARMTAMRNASDNAGELIQDLTLQMNRVRQADITQEIMEVVAGAEALS
jgi:F-type H+-transporting ATPase subunit gamma